jgi:hypothetical protein
MLNESVYIAPAHNPRGCLWLLQIEEEEEAWSLLWAVGQRTVERHS